MRAILTSSLGGYRKAHGMRIPAPILNTNGLLDQLKAAWPEEAEVLILPADPADHSKADNFQACFAASFPMSGLPVSSVRIVDDRNPQDIQYLSSTDVLLLAGGHVPTQNRFFHAIRLRERLQAFRGTLIAMSAGSMNCADTVYAGPERPGETIDPKYRRWLPGLGITQINIFPHMQVMRDEILDGLRMIEDITLPDSMGHTFLALNDGSYLVIEDQKTTLYGEAYQIRDGSITQICRDGASIALP